MVAERVGDLLEWDASTLVARQERGERGIVGGEHGDGGSGVDLRGHVGGGEEAVEEGEGGEGGED